MGMFILTAPSDYSGSTVTAAGVTYTIYNGQVNVDELGISDAIDQGFSFADRGLQTVLQLARRVRVINLTSNYVLSSASPGDLLKNSGTDNLTVGLPFGAAVEEGTIVSLIRLSTGTLTIVPASGVTLTGEDAVSSNGLAQLLYLGNNRWYSFGAVA